MTSDFENWSELQKLFDLADAAPAGDRERVLANACPDAQVRERVLALLRAAEQSPTADRSGSQHIGPYAIVRLIGSGGMGTVYLAERTLGTAVQRVALKVLAPHAAGPAFVDRFAREQQILAGLDHPGITRMLDAGLSDSGQPYLVMEFVEGVHLDAYCDSNKLDIPMRLALFQKICAAVDYAHRNLVVHLDLKPSNILVTSDGSVKLLDFGTAKLLQPDGTFTATIMATPAYASPEQLRNEPVTTASDTYSLGVILFELLTGRRPSGEQSVAIWISAVTPAAATERATTESRLRALLSGDLSTIILKCLGAAPGDRYPSVNALSEDIARYLEGRPILARPQTAIYQLTKFVKRNQGKVALTMILAVGLAGTLVYAWLAQRQALLEAQRAVRMQKFMSLLFKDAMPQMVGVPEPTVKQLLEKGALMLPNQLKDPADLRQAQLSIALSLYWNNDNEPAKRLYAEALASAKNAGDTAAEAEALGNLGSIAYSEGRNDEAKADVDRAFALSNAPGLSPSVRFLIAQKYVLINTDLGSNKGDPKAILKTAIAEARAKNVNPDEIAEALNYLGGQAVVASNLTEAESAYQDALAYFQRDTTDQCGPILSELGLAGVRREQNRPQEAAALLGPSYQRRVACWGQNAYTQNHEARLADALVASGKVAEGLAILEKAQPEWMKPPLNRSVVFANLKFLANAYVTAGRFQDAERVSSQAFELFGKELPETNRRRGGQELAWARALAGLNRFPEALPHAELANRIMGKPVTPLEKSNAELAHALLAEIRSRLGPH